MNEAEVRKQLQFLPANLVDIALEKSTIQTFPKGTELLRAHQYVQFLPIVLEGLIKVFSRFEERELLLYYIQPQQSCVMSFSSGLKNLPSKIHAVTEEESTVMLIPVYVLPNWLRDYPQFNTLFFEQYDLRYAEMLDTIEHILINKLDERLLAYLKQKIRLLNTTTLHLTHTQIANELGTVREVVSRMLKKLETEEKIEISSNGLKILQV